MRRAEQVLISKARMRAGPPMGFAKWSTPGAVLQLLRDAGIDTEEVVNWTRAPNDTGYIVYFYGEAPTEKMMAKLCLA